MRSRGRLATTDKRKARGLRAFRTGDYMSEQAGIFKPSGDLCAS